MYSKVTKDFIQKQSRNTEWTPWRGPVIPEWGLFKSPYALPVSALLWVHEETNLVVRGRVWVVFWLDWQAWAMKAFAGCECSFPWCIWLYSSAYPIMQKHKTEVGYVFFSVFFFIVLSIFLIHSVDSFPFWACTPKLVQTGFVHCALFPDMFKDEFVHKRKLRRVYRES